MYFGSLNVVNSGFRACDIDIAERTIDAAQVPVPKMSQKNEHFEHTIPAKSQEFRCREARKCSCRKQAQRAPEEGAGAALGVCKKCCR